MQAKCYAPVYTHSRDNSVGLTTDSWPIATSTSSMTSPAGRRGGRYDDGPARDRHVALQVPAGQLVSADVMDRARRHELAAAVANDNDDVAMSTRRNEMTRTAVRPWLMH